MARELIDEMITLIHSESNNNPAPKPCKIVKNYGDAPFCDVEVEDLGILIHIKTIGSTEIGLEGIICFLNGDLNQGIVITSSKTVTDTNSIQIEDLNLDVDFNVIFGVSGRDDLIYVETFLKQK